MNPQRKLPKNVVYEPLPFSPSFSQCNQHLMPLIVDFEDEIEDVNPTERVKWNRLSELTENSTQCSHLYDRVSVVLICPFETSQLAIAGPDILSPGPVNPNDTRG